MIVYACTWPPQEQVACLTGHSSHTYLSRPALWSCPSPDVHASGSSSARCAPQAAHPSSSEPSRLLLCSGDEGPPLGGLKVWDVGGAVAVDHGDALRPHPSAVLHVSGLTHAAGTLLATRSARQLALYDVTLENTN